MAKQIFRTRITHKPYVWFKIQKYMAKYKFDGSISYYSKSALCGHIIECLIKKDFDRLKQLSERFEKL